MRADIEKLQTHLRATEMACAPSGIQSNSNTIYPAVKNSYPDLCDDSYRCDEVCAQGNDQPEWKHAVRRVQQQLARRDDSRVRRHEERGNWFYEYPGLYLVPVSDDWIDQFERTVASPIETATRDDLSADLIDVLPARFWGATEGPQTERYFEAMRPGDLILFYRNGEFFGGGRVSRTFDDPALGDWLWDNPASRFVFTIDNYRDQGPDIDRIWDALGYSGDPRVQGFLRVKDERIESLREGDESVEQVVFGSITPSESDTSDADLPTDQRDGIPDRETIVRDRVRRDRGRVVAMKAMYDDCCQVCGQRLLSSPTSGYSEVHHIKPLGEPHEGPDIRPNMLVLCPNHHVDFDNGMIWVDPETLALTHAYDDSITGHQLTRAEDHKLEREFLRYHRSNIAHTDLEFC